jgi:hypothetical protein
MLQEGVVVKKKVRFAKNEKSAEKEKYRKTPKPVPVFYHSTRKRGLKKSVKNVTRRF